MTLDQAGDNPLKGNYIAIHLLVSSFLRSSFSRHSYLRKGISDAISTRI